MKNQRAIVIAALICAVLLLTFWLGYETGRSSKKETVSVASVETAKNERTEPVQPAPEIARRPLEIPPRDPAAKSNLVDLSLWYNAGLQDDWHVGAPDNNFASLPSGVQTFADTEFDVRGLIQLRATDPGSKVYPLRVDGIRLGMRCSKLHFLHNTLFGRLVRPGEAIGAYTLHYADGETFSVPLRLGANILDWWGSPAQLPPGGPAVLAWEGVNGASVKRKQRINLTKFTLENPRPEAEISTLDFVGEGKTAGPFLIAITAEL